MAKNLWKIKNSVLIGILLLAIIILGNWLRRYNYASVPHPGETADEYAFAWAGLSLIENHMPISWSYVKSSYDNVEYQKIDVDAIYEKIPTTPPFTIVKPWFDKPPGFALLIGAYEKFKGIENFAEAYTGIIRRPMLWIGIITTLLIFVLGQMLYGKWIGLLSALFYSVIPMTVISSRLTLAENGYIPLFLLSIILFRIFLAKKNKTYLILASFLAAVAVLFKLSGIAVLLSLLLLGLKYFPPREKVKNLVLIFSIGILG